MHKIWFCTECCAARLEIKCSVCGQGCAVWSDNPGYYYQVRQMFANDQVGQLAFETIHLAMRVAQQMIVEAAAKLLKSPKSTKRLHNLRVAMKGLEITTGKLHELLGHKKKDER